MLSNHTMSSIKAASLFISPDQVSLFYPLSIFRDLLCTEFIHRITRLYHVEDFIPIRRHLQAFVDGEDAAPVEAGVGLVAIQFEKLRLVKGLRIGEIIPGSVAPVFDKPIGHIGDRQIAAVLGAEVPGAGIFFRILPQGGARA